MGESASAVLAVLDSVRDRLDGREPFRDRTDRHLWLRAVHVRDVVFAAGAPPGGQS